MWQALVKGSLQIFLIKALRNLRRDATVVPILQMRKSGSEKLLCLPKVRKVKLCFEQIG